MYCQVSQQPVTLQRKSCSEPEQRRRQHGPDLKQKQRRNEGLSPCERCRRTQVGQIGLRREEERHESPAAYDHTCHFPVLLDQAAKTHCSSYLLRLAVGLQSTHLEATKAEVQPACDE